MTCINLEHQFILLGQRRVHFQERVQQGQGDFCRCSWCPFPAKLYHQVRILLPYPFSINGPSYYKHPYVTILKYFSGNALESALADDVMVSEPTFSYLCCLLIFLSSLFHQCVLKQPSNPTTSAYPAYFRSWTSPSPCVTCSATRYLPQLA